VLRAREPRPVGRVAERDQLEERGRGLAMATIEFEEGALKVDATIIGESLGMSPRAFRV